MLTLPIKKQWFDMILSGEKTEEYRGIKPYYTSRFEHLWQGSLIGGNAHRKICFRNGYSADSPSFIADCTLSMGYGKPEWGAVPNVEFYILTIHEITME